MHPAHTGLPSVAQPPPYRGARFPGRGPVLLLLLLLAATLTLPATVSADTNTGRAVRIAGVVYLGDLPTVVAEHDGLFAANGVDAEVAFNDSGRYNLARLRAGETDFAMMALTPLVLDRMTDATEGDADDPVILGSLVHSTRLNDVVALAGNGVETPADLAGRRIGLAKGTNAEFVWWLFAHFHGLDPQATELVDRAITDIPQALARGEVDAAVVWQPWSSRLEQEFGDRLLNFEGANVYTAKWLLVTTRGLVEERPGLARRVLMAYRDSIDTIERDPAHAIAVYSRRAGIPAEIMRRQWDAMDYDLNLDWSLVASFQEQLDWARRTGYPVAGGEISVVSLIAARPLRTVFPTGVGLPSGFDGQGSAP